MSKIIKYTAIAFLSTTAWADNHWQKKKTNFEQHTQELHQRKTNKLKTKSQYLQYKKNLHLEKSQLKWTFLENRLQTNHREKANQLFHLFSTSKKHSKKLKRKFIQIRNKNNKLKEKHKIPLEKQLFL